MNEQMTIVIVGHVDHGKSTVIGRLLADTGSLPQGKLDQVREMCRRTARPFEYAFLLDALKDEQAQGITIDAARCFFKTARRHYLVFDAPGHVEFLKNMVTGAAHAEAALLVIDAKEGIRDNSRRHGALLSMLGVRQVTVLVNKMDLVDNDEGVFCAIREEYTGFLAAQGVQPRSFIPVAALHGDNIAGRSKDMPWYKGPTVLEQLDAFENRKAPVDLPLRFPVQDVYKFTEDGDDRRIVAGTVDSGAVRAGDAVVFYPSGKKTRIVSVERFSAPANPGAAAGEAVGFTVDTQLYVRPGELMTRVKDAPPKVATRFRANVFWMGRAPLIQGKTYKLKLATARVPVTLASIVRVLDAAELDSSTEKQEVERHDVAEVVLETAKPVALDLIADHEGTGRFVLVDQYEIAGGGIVLEVLGEEGSLFERAVRRREEEWFRGSVTPAERAVRYGHQPKFVVICGGVNTGKKSLADALERRLVDAGCKAYYQGLSNMTRGLAADLDPAEAAEHIRRLGELARLMTDAGLVFITTVSEVDDHDIARLRQLNAPADIVVVGLGAHGLEAVRPDVDLPAGADTSAAVDGILAALKGLRVLSADYVI